MNPSESTPSVPVAIIGIGCLFPKADNLERYWSNIRHGVDAIGDIPDSHWRPSDYFDSDPKKADHTYARRGGFLSPVDFPALELGIAPNTLEATDTTQLLGLMVARDALVDAGYGPDREFDRNRVSVILGVTGTLELVIPLGARLGHPIWRKALKEAGVAGEVAEDVVKRISDSYVGWQEASFPGLLGNVVAGRIANRLDLGGTNCVVDAACASSLSAVHLALLELASGRCDMALSGGMDTFNDIFMYMCFSKTPALSPTGNARPFDANADGTILGEGLGCVLLKRLADAERDGDRIYAVIRSMGTSSDGKGHAIYAPSSAGQMKALRRAYELAKVEPETIELIEAHGTGTKAGDAAELSALRQVYSASQNSADGPWCAVGSVKSQIGHTKAAAGVAGLIKAALALHHKVLPPTIKVERPAEAFADPAAPFYINCEQRPWLPGGDHPRRAAVSSFGFGGSNFHCVLEESQAQSTPGWDGSVEIVALSSTSVAELQSQLEDLGSRVAWPDLAYRAAQSRERFQVDAPFRVVMVLERDKTDVKRIVRLANERLADSANSGKEGWSHPDGVYFGQDIPSGQLAFLFPGQGSQYVGMLRDLTCQFPILLYSLAAANAVLRDNGSGPGLDFFIYPRSAFDEATRERQASRLRNTAIAQPALGAVEIGAAKLLWEFGVVPDALAGHSFGELVALCLGGAYSESVLHQLAQVRGALMGNSASKEGAMLAVRATRPEVEAILREARLDLTIANHNAPKQVVLSGDLTDLAAAGVAFDRRGVSTARLPVSAAFHSPALAATSASFLQALYEVEFVSPSRPVYANTTAARYPKADDEARRLLAGQLAKPVAFNDEIQAMYAAGVRTFVEVGPGNVLSGLVGSILDSKPHAALALDSSRGKRSGIADLARLLANLAALGHPVNLDRWESGSAIKKDPAQTKATLTIPLCGANYVAPRQHSSPPVANQTPKDAEGQTRNGQNAKVTQAPATNGRSAAKSPPEPTPRRAEEPPPEPRVQVPAVATAPYAAAPRNEALRFAQEGLAALQQVGEQTAQLHRQFLEGQDRALQAIQLVLGQQAALLAGSPMPPLSIPTASPPPVPVIRTVAAPVSVEAVPPPMTTTAKPDLSVAAIAEHRQAAMPAPEPLVAANSAGPLHTDGQEVQRILFEVVSEKTGYPPEMLEPHMELDADLGIDSIKRVEIFSVLQERLPHAPPVKPDQLGTLRTLEQVRAYLHPTGSNGSAPKTANAPIEPTVARAGVGSSYLPILLQIVVDRTGYSLDAIQLDMELDADLGIDSIRLVEIFSALRQQIPEVPLVRSEQAEKLRTLRDVAHLLGIADEQLPAKPDRTEPQTPLGASAQALKATAIEKQEERGHAAPFRFVVLPREAKLGDSRPQAFLPGAGEIWLTLDDTGLAEALASRLGLLSYKAVLISGAEALVRPIPKDLGGLILLGSPTAVGLDAAVDAFALLRRLAPALRNGNRSTKPILATIARLDGAFGFGDSRDPIAPWSGGLAGLAKTARHEWPEVSCRAFDVAADLEDLDEAALLLSEELMRDGPPELGLSRAGWRLPQLTLAPLEQPTTPNRLLQAGDVVVVTGGARGVTAEAALALAEAYAPRLILFGRSPSPTQEPGWLSQLNLESDIKRGLIEQAKSPLAPKEVQARYHGVVTNREMLRNLARLRATGCDVQYIQVDVRDGQAVVRHLRDIEASFGPIRGFVHGAGILSDRRIEDLTEEQFRSVLETKLAGLQAVLDALSPGSLRLLGFFSSTTARLGRRGQAAYGVANEILNKIAVREARSRPDCRVVSFNWGPWDGGMVTPALKALFEEEGVAVLGLRQGASALVKEFEHSSGPVEVVLAGGPLPSSSQTEPSSDAAAEPAARLSHEVSLTAIPILRDHILDGRAVLPMALTMEFIVHAALHGNPGLVFHGVNNFRLLKGIAIPWDGSATIQIVAQPARKDAGEFIVPVEVRSTRGDGRDHPHARAEVVLSARLPKAPAAASEPPTRPYLHGKQEIYAELLFHGPALQSLEMVEGCASDGIVGVARVSATPGQWLREPLRPNWTADPLALDSAFQLMILWTLSTHGVASLPSTVGRYRQFRRAFPADAVRIVARIQRDTAALTVADIEFQDLAGEVIATLSGYECVRNGGLKQAFQQNRFSTGMARTNQAEM